MSDLSGIQVGGNVYNFKDNEARDNIEDKLSKSMGGTIQADVQITQDLTVEENVRLLGTTYLGGNSESKYIEVNNNSIIAKNRGNDSELYIGSKDGEVILNGGYTIKTSVPADAIFTDTIVDIVNDLKSDDTNKALSASMGKKLYSETVGLFNISKTYDLNNLTKWGNYWTPSIQANLNIPQDLVGANVPCCVVFKGITNNSIRNCIQELIRFDTFKIYKRTKINNTWSEWKIDEHTKVVDNLTSTNTKEALSANMGRKLYSETPRMIALRDDYDLNNLNAIGVYYHASGTQLVNVPPEVQGQDIAIYVTYYGIKNSSDIKNSIQVFTRCDTLQQYKRTKINNVWSAWKEIKEITQVEVVDNLNSTSKDKALSANQGKVLNGILDSKIDVSEIGKVNGIASLNSQGKIVSNQLPSYVDDVVTGTYNSTTGTFTADTVDGIKPTVNLDGKIYIDKNTNKTYRYTGSSYAVVSETIAIGNTAETAFRGDYGLQAYTHAVTNKGNAYTDGLYKFTTNSEGHITSATSVTKEDIIDLGINNVTVEDVRTSTSTTNALSAAQGKYIYDHSVYMASLSSTYNLDNINTIGRYWCTSVAKLVNAPTDFSGLNAAGLVVFDGVTNSSSVKNNVQVITRLDTMQQYKRHRIDGTWSAWKEIDDFNITYNTGRLKIE